MKSFEDPPVRDDILDEMRLRASRGAKVRELSEFVQARLGYGETMYVPVLAYFVKAFGVHLRDVLPIREWIGTEDDQEIDAAIMPALERTRDYWLPLVPKEVMSPQ